MQTGGYADKDADADAEVDADADRIRTKDNMSHPYSGGHNKLFMVLNLITKTRLF